MAEENTTTQTQEQKPTALEKQGASAADLNEGQTTGGAPKAPEVSNAPPAKEPTAEEKAAEEAAKKKALEGDAADMGEEEVPAEKTEAEKAAEEAGAKEFATYDDENAQAAVTLLKESGVTPAEADTFFKKAVESGKIEDIDIEGMTKKLGKEKTTLVLNSVKAFYNTKMANTQNVFNAVVEAAGGKDSFVKVRDFIRGEAKKNPELAKQIPEWNKMLDLNKDTALLAVAKMVETYNKHPSNKSLQVNMVHGDRAATEIGVGGETLSRSEYLEKVKVAEAKGDSQEVSRLRAVRKASR